IRGDELLQLLVARRIDPFCAGIATVDGSLRRTHAFPRFVCRSKAAARGLRLPNHRRDDWRARLRAGVLASTQRKRSTDAKESTVAGCFGGMLVFSGDKLTLAPGILPGGSGPRNNCRNFLKASDITAQFGPRARRRSHSRPTRRAGTDAIGGNGCRMPA